MTIIGFAFTKLSAEQKKQVKGNLKINSNVRIDSLEKTNLVFDNKRSALKANFTYTVNYQPSVGIIEFKGDILFLQDTPTSEKLLAEWEKKKALPKKLTALLVNNILQKCTIQAIIASRDVGLPPPVALPGIKVSDKKKEAK